MSKVKTDIIYCGLKVIKIINIIIIIIRMIDQAYRGLLQLHFGVPASEIFIHYQK